MSASVALVAPLAHKETGPLRRSKVCRTQILTKEDLESFFQSQTFADYFGFIEKLNNSVIGLTLSSDVFISKVDLADDLNSLLNTHCLTACRVPSIYLTC
jgi:hypothetical protein